MPGSRGSQSSKKPAPSSPGVAAPRVSRTGQFREQQRREALRQQRMILAVGAVLAVVVITIVAGLVLTVYLPPRAQVLTVGDRNFNAGQLADRAFYLATTGSGAAQQTPADEAVRSLTQQEILLQVGAGMVDPVEDFEVRAEIAQRIGLDEGFTDEAYAQTLAEYLRANPISRETLEGIVRAGIVEDRLRELQESELPEAGDQFNILAIRSNDRPRAQAVVDAVRDGADFREAAAENGFEAADVLDLGWYAPTVVGTRLRDVLEDLQTGDISDPVDDAQSIGFEVFYIETRTSEEPLEENVREQLANLVFEDFLEEHEETVGVENSLTDSHRRWIADRVRSKLSDLSGG